MENDVEEASTPNVTSRTLNANVESTTTSNANVESTTTSLDKIFSTLDIDELECQKRFICETMEAPKKFEPISNIIYLLLR
jgi:hypothetical protein